MEQTGFNFGCCEEAKDLRNDYRSEDSTHHSHRTLSYLSERPSCTSCKQTPSPWSSLAGDLELRRDIQHNRTTACSRERGLTLARSICVC